MVTRSSSTPPYRASLSCYRDPRHLHSFPTRRSSDLAESFGWQNVFAIALIPIALTLGVFAVFAQDSPNQDRKSTRLNSSHRCISYAVFCLKKKKLAVDENAHRLLSVRGIPDDLPGEV